MNIKLGICVGVAAALTVALGGPERLAEAGPNDCGSVTADKTLTLAGATHGVSAQSGTEYNHNGCERFVTDVVVDAGAVGTGNDLPAFRLSTQDPKRQGALTLNLSKEECGNFQSHVSFYKKGHGQSTFTLIGEVNEKGVWRAATPSPSNEPAYCGSETLGEYKPLPTTLTPPNAGADTYRIAARFALNGNRDPVTSTAAHAEKAPVIH